MAVLERAADGDAAFADARFDPVFDRVFDERLQQHAGQDEVERCWIDILLDLQARAKAHVLDVEVLVNRFELLAQCDEVVLASEQAAEQTRELDDENARGLGL